MVKTTLLKFVCAGAFVSVLVSCAIPVGGPTSGTSGGTIGLPGGATPTATLHFGVQTKTSGCVARGAYPDPDCTPGAIFPEVTAAQVCVSGYSSGVRNVPQSEKEQVYAEYGIFSRTAGEYEVDHFVSLELGGSNDISNLFPEAANPTPGFHEKDKVENYLHSQLCSGAITLAEAQRQIATDWVAVYQRMGN